MTEGDRPSIFVVSDATAETAERALRAALIQFQGVEPDVRIFSTVRKDDRLDEILRLAASRRALLLYTMVNPEQREHLARRGDELGLPTVDLIGQLMHQLAAFLGQAPRGRPGIPRLTPDYFRRIEAVEFSVQHDDGQAPAHLNQADIVLVGLSRTSKTPLSTYLANRGKKVANVPIVLGLPIPDELDTIDQRRMFGLTIDVATLVRIRRSRIKALNMPAGSDYARRDHVIEELEYAREIFRAHPIWPVIDVSQRAIEETAAIVLRILERRRREEAQSGSND